MDDEPCWGSARMQPYGMGRSASCVCMYEYRIDKVLSSETRADELDLPDEGIFCPVSVKT